MTMQTFTCSSCNRPVVIDLNSFSLGRTSHATLAVKCPLCWDGFEFGYVSEAYEVTQERLAAEELRNERAAARAAKLSSGGAVSSGLTGSASSSNQRANVRIRTIQPTELPLATAATT